MYRKSLLLLFLAWLTLVSAVAAQVPNHTRLLISDNLQSDGIKPHAEVVNVKGKFIAGQGWQVSDKFAQLQFNFYDVFPSEATIEFKVKNFYPPSQLEEASDGIFSVWSQPNGNRLLMDPTPASFFYIKTETKFVTGNTAKLLLRLHPHSMNDAAGDPRQTIETDYLPWDASKEYTFRIIYNSRSVWMTLDGVQIAYKSFENSEYLRESLGYVCLGNTIWDGITGPIYTSLKIYAPATKYPFQDVTKSAGVDADRTGGAQGLSVMDVNGDGLEDVHSVYLYETTIPRPNKLFVQNPDHTFTEEAETRGIGEAGIWGPAVWVDVEGDGDLDLVQSSRTSAPRLYINSGGQFSDQAGLRGMNGTGRETRAILPIDLENDGDLDLVFMDGSQAHEVYVNRGTGLFDIVNKGLSAPTGSVQGAVAADFTGDGYVDIFMTRRDMACALFFNLGNGSFREEASSRGVAFVAKTNHPSAADIDNDGDLDLLIGIRGTTADKSPLNKVYLNNGTGTFTDASDAAGIKIDSYALYPADFDNDGFLDLYGLRYDRIMDIAPTSRIFLNRGDRTFSELTGTGAENLFIDGRGASLFDYDNDGRVDIFGTARGKQDELSSIVYGRNALLKNNIDNSKHYLRVAILDRYGKVNGIGTRMWMYPAGRYDQAGSLLGYREIMAIQGYQSQTSLVQHFGLGQNTAVDIKVKLPSGKILSYLNVSADRLYNISPFATQPKAIARVKGDAQTAAVNTTLTDSITVRVTDIDGKVLAGYPVTFEMVLGGGTINGSSGSQQVYSDNHGLARAAWKVGTAVGTANNSLRAVAVKEDGSALDNSPLLFTASATTGPAATMQKVSGDGQQNYIGQLLAEPLVVKVTDAYGNAVSGYKVNFDISLGNGSLDGTASSHAEAMTNAEGKAQTLWKLGSLIGTQKVNASSAFNAASPQEFRATAVEPQRQILMQSGNLQTGTVNQALALPLVVKLQDFRGNVVANEKVNFAIISGGGKISGQTTFEAFTNSSGLASATVTLGTAAGDTNNVIHAIMATAIGSPVVFKAGARAGTAAKLVEVSLNNQTGKVNRLLAKPYIVRVTDAYANPVAGHLVDYAVTSGGGTINGLGSVKVLTDASGYATATLRLGTSVGTNTVAVSATGLQGSPLTFAAEAQAGIPSRFFEISGNRQKGSFGQMLPFPFVVGVTDSFANPVANHPVQFKVSSGNGSLNGLGLASALTNTSGRASVTLTMGTSSYLNQVTASTQYNGVDVGAAVVFVATTSAGDPDSLAYVSGNYQIGRVGASLAQPFKIQVLDVNGVPVANHTVSFFAVMYPETSFGGKQQLDVKTDANGYAGATGTIGTAFGENNYVFQARASYKEVLLRNAPLEFFASGRRSTARKMVYVSGNNQEGVVGSYLSDSLKVRVVDDSNVPVSLHPVAFEVTQGSCTINGSSTKFTAMSNNNGIAMVAIKLAATPSAIRIQASTDDGVNPNLTGSPFVFDATAVIGPPSAQKSTRQVTTPVVADGYQSAKVSVTLKDAEGNAIANKTVQIYTTGLDVQVRQPDSATDLNGTTLGSITSTRAGRVKVWTVVEGRMIPADTSIVLFTAGAPVQAVPFGSGQMVLRGTVLPMPLGLNLYDVNGNPVPDVNVTFTVTSGGGKVLEPQPVKTNLDGMASVKWQLGSQVDTQTLQAVVTGLSGNPIVYSAIAMPPNPGTMLMVSGDKQIGVLNKTLADSFKVVVRDSTGNPAEGLQVYFHFTGQGQAVSPNPLRTDRRGMAAVLYRPGGAALGEFKATATVPGLTQSVEFTFLVQSELTVFLSKQDIPPNNRPNTTLDLVAQVLDGYKRPVKNQLLTFAVEAGGGMLQGTLPATSDENGFARIKWRLGQPGAQRVKVSPVNASGTPLFFTTNVVNTKPKLSVPAARQTLPGQLVAAVITAVDAEGDAITIKVRNLPSGASFDSTKTFAFQWTPSQLQSGASYDVKFIATDSFAAADTAVWRITVESVNRAPKVLSMTPSDSVLELHYLDRIEFSVQAYDPDNTPVTYFWRVNGIFAGNLFELVMEPEQGYFPEENWVQVEISDGKASTTVRWHLFLSEPAMAVRLTSFEATALAHAAQLRWQTAHEVDNLGFTVLRSDRSDGPYEPVSTTLIPVSANGQYSYVDESVQSGRTYFYKIRDIDRNGRSNDNGPVSLQIALPDAIALAQNYPNPFNPVTTIAFDLPKAQVVQLRVFNLAGQIVRELANGTFAAGSHQVVWDAHDDQGRAVTTGMYYYVLQTGGQSMTKKLLLTK